MRRGGAPPGVRAGRIERIALHDFLRLIAGNHRVGLDDAPQGAHSHGDLVQSLRRSGIISSEKVHRAMLICPRGTFVPPNYANEAYVDAPIRVEEHEFNISAPHMHATGLEALDVCPGEAFLDVGCGCGVVAACAAYMVGAEGTVVGVDIRKECIELSTSNTQTLREQNQDYRGTAPRVSYLQHNIFIPDARHKGRYDKVHIGAACPPDKLSLLLQLLKPEGGKLMVPVGSDLRLLTKNKDGSMSNRTLSQVRFSDLEVPTDAEIVLATLQQFKQQHQKVVVPPSTLGEDLVKVDKIGSPCCDVSMETDQDMQQLSTTPDCAFVGHNWKLNIHKAVLKGRCDLYRARLSSGMRDSDDHEIRVPDNFSSSIMHKFVHYLYHDDLADGIEPNEALELLHAASYYGASRLIVLCESVLAEELLGCDEDSASEAAAGVLMLADENGLHQLKDVAVTYIIGHYDKVAATEGYKQLSKEQVDLIAREAFLQLRHFTQLLTDLSASGNQYVKPRW